MSTFVHAINRVQSQYNLGQPCWSLSTWVLSLVKLSSRTPLTSTEQMTVLGNIHWNITIHEPYLKDLGTYLCGDPCLTQHPRLQVHNPSWAPGFIKELTTTVIFTFKNDTYI